MTIAGIKTEVNLNTVVAIVGFLATFAGLITVWNQTQYKQEDFDKWIAAHDQVHETISKEIASLHQVDEDRAAKMLEFAFKAGQLEKHVDAIDDRVGRVTESYGNQFTDIRTQLGAIATQLALTNQTLQQIASVKVGDTPGELKR